MFRHISKITASTLRYTSSLFSQYNQEQITPILVETWLQDMQIGLDALFNDEMILAEDTFSTCITTSKEKSPFHAFGLAVLVYTKAMLAMEKSKIDEAIQCVLNVENTLKRIMTSTTANRKRTKSSVTATASSYSIPLDIQNESQFNDGLDLHFELLQANCILMSATLQFLRDSWIDNLKAAYDLRKAYKIYEHLFQVITGTPIEEFEARHISMKMPTKARRTVSCDTSILQQQHSFRETTVDDPTLLLLYDETIINGAYFGIGLFNVIFSILPAKVGKILNSLGFHSSRSTAIYLLKKSFNSHTMYSSLSSLVLLSFYTNISIYIHPKINQLFHFKDAKGILETMKQRYPNGPIWCLIEGKFKKIQGQQLDKSICLLKKAKQAQPLNTEKDIQHMESTEEDYFRNASITEFAQFRSFAIYELGWAYIYAGDYFQASESFFCLESMCNWSRVFYHYIATCCMIADGLYDKAVLEIRQIINMLDQKKKLNSRISSNEHYAESRVRLWMETSRELQMSLRDTLKYHVINPVWELVYLWNGITHWKEDIVMDINAKIAKEWSTNEESQDDPMLCLLMGVIKRDVEKKNDVAIECFNKILLKTEDDNVKNSWIIPYAMYEIAATYCKILLKDSRSRGHINEYKSVILGWIESIESYYIEHHHDIEWETRMQIRCQLLIESCNNVFA